MTSQQNEDALFFLKYKPVTNHFVVVLIQLLQPADVAAAERKKRMKIQKKIFLKIIGKQKLYYKSLSLTVKHNI